MRRVFVPVVLLALLALVAGPALAAPPANKAKAGAKGIGDPYFPTDGNGGYDVGHYDLRLAYDPADGILTGLATISAEATHGLTRFNLDYDGPRISAISVDGVPAKWKASKGELTITPKTTIADGAAFTVAVAYQGIPQLLVEEAIGIGGWIATDGGAVAVGQPHGATTWFPANDHPLDPATYALHLTVPDGLTAVSNGRLAGTATSAGWTTFDWIADDPMASYLATVSISNTELDAYSADGIDYWDAIDSDLMAPLASPTDGTRFALSGVADSTYQRLARTIEVPAGGATMTLDVMRDIEPDWDFMVIEAHTVGEDDWTTLADANGHTSPSTGNPCPFWHGIHPFLEHYQGDDGQGGCTSTGTSGSWNAATGRSDGAETWSVDLGAFAGSQVEVAIAYISDDVVQFNGVWIDHIVVSTGEGSTSFEDDGDELDGWAVVGPPAGSPGNDADWSVGTSADVPPSQGAVATAAFARQPEVIAFLAESFGPYPFGEAGGIVPDVEGLGFALETQTRPVYARDFFGDPLGADAVVVHELAHQWYGDSLRVGRWQDIWLNEGFASYAEWLWAEDQGLDTAQAIFDFWATIFPPDDPFWQLTIGDPGPESLFDFAVYIRGAMTLHALRTEIGDADFFEILESWAQERAGTDVTTPEFIAHAEEVSGMDLQALFERYLFTPGYPLDAVPLSARIAAPGGRAHPATVLVGERLARMAEGR